MTEGRGIYYVPCEIEGLPLDMVFDTGASYVCISRPIANILLQHGMISEEDIHPGTQLTVGDGYTESCSSVNIRNVRIGNIMVHDVQTVILDAEDTILMFGQSAIKKLGKVILKGQKVKIIPSRDCEILPPETNSVFEQWNPRSGFFKSNLYGVTWSLPSSAKWERSAGFSSEIKFKAVSDYAMVVLSVKEQSPNIDLWDIYDDCPTMLPALAMRTAFDETKIRESKCEKSQLHGKHTIINTFIETLQLPNSASTYDLHSTSYTVVCHGNLITLTLKMYDNILKSHDCDNFFDSVFNSIVLDE